MKKSRPIDQQQMRSVFNYDPATGVLTRLPIAGSPQATARFSGKPAGTVHRTADGKSYVAVQVGAIRYMGHRVIWTMLHGAIPQGMQIDHIDGDGLNNRASNLRLVTEYEQQHNVRRSTRNSTGYVGVRRADTKSETYQAYAVADGAFHHLGVASTPEEAYALRSSFNERAGFHPNHGQERAL